MTFNEILTKFRESITEKEKGTKFELLMRSWLLTDPRFASQISKIWMWDDFPAAKEISMWGDVGIDLVAYSDLGEYWAIQCKCYAETTVMEKGNVDSFLSTSSKTFTDPATGKKTGFARRLWISTTNNWGRNAEEAFENQAIPVTRIDLFALETSPVDWDLLYSGQEGIEALDKKAEKTPKAHQLEAIAEAKKYFIDEKHERGKLIMACGTGKTYTSLRIVEDLLNQKGLVLFLVPSISLLGQTLNEWSFDARKKIKAVCICSDATASQNRKAKIESDNVEQSARNLAAPANTDPVQISKRLRAYRNHDGLVVVFSTYQSIEAVAEAQKQVLKDTNNEFGKFDFIVCDEAHRTTGARTQEDGDSDFSKIHKADFILGTRRMYMTATPKVYSDTIKAKAVDEDFILYSMDNEEWYGKEFYRLGFGKAVDLGLLTDYKVLVLTVSENDIPQELKYMIRKDINQELAYNDTAKLVGVISSLSKVIAGDKGETWEVDPRLMHRALAFCSQIGSVDKSGSSKNVAAALPLISQEIQKGPENYHGKYVAVEARHVDGTMSSAKRSEDLKWLASEPEFENQCRLITNVRCLSEGVDVPALDSVIFLSARNSQVDVVQSVGRVMRNFHKGLSDEKKYGYIIIPVVIPTEADPGTILEANDFKIVWSILNALRSHDDRFNAHVNKINLNKKKNDRIILGGSGIGLMATNPEDLDTQLEIRFGSIEDKIYAKLVEKVGDRQYWELWAKQMGQVAIQFINRINELIKTGEYKKDIDEFVTSLQRNLNPSVTQDEAVEMLAQHMITKPVFDALFDQYQFVKNNSVSVSMETMLHRLHMDAFEKDTKVLANFYESVKKTVGDVDNLEGKQTVIKNLYEKFFKGAFPKTVDKLGIVYTPIECVDFILNSVEDLLRKEFNASISDKNVHLLDPFTGTGTFITRLLQLGIIKPEDLERKYKEEIHCNELVLLAYYIADVNIEAVFHDLTKREHYLPYNNICLTDTFQLAEPVSNKMFTPFFQQNNENVLKLRQQPIRVIVGNPPYSVGQKSANDNAQNLSYPVLDKRIADTYAKSSIAANLKSTYDSYIKAFRWSSDRIPKDEGGIVAFISNGAWIDGLAQDGMRRCLEKEFSSIYVLNLRGNQRTSGELSRKEGGKIFGSGSRTPITITFLVKNPAAKKEKATIYYHDIGDYLTRETKLAMVKDFKSISRVNWEVITPNDKADWINQRDGAFDSLIPLWPEKKFYNLSKSIFSTYAIGIATNRDAWVSGSSQQGVSENMQKLINAYNNDALRRVEKVDDLLNDEHIISWTRALKRDALNGIVHKFNNDCFVEYSYRPFQKKTLYYDKPFIESPGIFYCLFPNKTINNNLLCISGVGQQKPFSVLATDSLTDLQLVDKGQCFPLYWYEENNKKEKTLFDDSSDDKYIRHDGITDWILKEVRGRFSGTKVITKETIFYYVYGILHSPQYRERFADDLKKSLPRIPIVERIEDFMTFSKIGRELADLHLNYESVEPANVTVKGDNGNYIVEKMRFDKVRNSAGKLEEDKSVIIYNNNIRIENIPLEAYNYVVNGKSAIEWIMERYAVTIDKASGIKNDPNDWATEHNQPRYILDLLLSIINLSLKTNALVAQLPSIDNIKTKEGREGLDTKKEDKPIIVQNIQVNGDLNVQTLIGSADIKK